MVSMKYIKSIKENLKDPKKKALTQLGLYVIFFVFVAIVLRMPNNNTEIKVTEESKTPIEYYENMTSYNYKVTYTNIDKVDVIEGIYYNNTSLFTFNNIKYYYDKSLYIIDNDSYYLGNIEYNVSKIFNKNFNNIIEELEEVSKTTYKDGTIVTNYKIDATKIYDYLYEQDSFYEGIVNIDITENQNEIHNIKIDLTNLGLNLTNIEVEYSYLNQIENLNFNKDNYTYRENL